jgi:virginiamycin B lyase
MVRRLAVLAGVLLWPVVTSVPASATTASVVEYAIAGSGPNGIVAGPDANLWFTDAGHNAIDRLTTDGVVTMYSLPTTNANPTDITAGPDGNIWFLEGNGVPIVKVGKITTGGAITEYPTRAGMTAGITAGPDGNIWFDERDQFAVAKMTPTGSETQYLIPGGLNGGPNNGADPVSITAGPDGNLWVTDESENVIWKLSTSGAFTRINLPAPNRGAYGITVGADGNLWIGEPSQSMIGRMTTVGVLTEFAIPTVSAGIGGIAQGPDGNVWFSENRANRVARITPAGDIQELPIPTANSLPRRPTAGPDQHVWFPEGVGKLGTVVFAMDIQPWFVQPRAGAPSAPQGPWYIRGGAPSALSPAAKSSQPGPFPHLPAVAPSRSSPEAPTGVDVASALATTTERIAQALRAII